MKRLPFLHYLAAATLVTVILLLMYATVQQTYRSGLNDPQVQIARDISLQLEQNKPIENFIHPDTIDMKKSLSPFFILYDALGNPVRSNALLNGRIPQVPKGLFEELNGKSQHEVTWQPQSGVRMAMVIVKVNTQPVQFVAAGRSMAEVEGRVSRLITIIFIAWIICLAIISITAVYNFFNK